MGHLHQLLIRNNKFFLILGYFSQCLLQGGVFLFIEGDHKERHKEQGLLNHRQRQECSGLLQNRVPLTCGCLAGYQISWEVYGRNESRLARSLPNSTLEYKITGLASLTTYTIEVAATTAQGSGWVTSSTISSGVPPGWSPCRK